MKSTRDVTCANLIVVRCVLEVIVGQNLHFFNNADIIYYWIQYFAWTQQTIIKFDNAK